MTRRHARYLAQYPMRIHRKRLKRRRKAKVEKMQRRADIGHLRDVLREYVATRPALQPIRVGKQTFATRLKNMFRRPTV